MPCRDDHDDELKREIQAHLEWEAEERVADGMSEADAHYAARRAFGSVTRTQEDVRAVWTRRWIEEIVQDVRYALRTLRKAPGFTTVAVLTLALGIGANTAMFSVVNAVILQPLAYPHPEQLRFLTTRFERRGAGRARLSVPEYVELTELNQSFSVVGAFTIGEVNLAALDRPRRVTRATVNAELLEALAVQPERGRWFRRDETRANGPALVILSHELWRSAFGAREDIVGRTIEIDGLTREVIGIMPAGFDLMDNGVDVWLPLQLAPALRQFRESHFLNVLGRLKDDVTAEQAEAELASLVASWGARAGVSGHVFTPGDHVMQMEPVQDEIVGSARRALWMLQAAVAFVLLIACANLANLLLARAETRRRELAVRAALGAGRRRLLAQFMAEGVVLSLVGGALGLALAWAGVRALIVAYPDGLPRVADIAIDPAVLGFTLLVSVVTGVAFGLAPLLHSLNDAPSRLLNERATRGATSARHGVRRALVAAEVALAVVLVVGAGLMFRTVVNLMNVDAGFDRSRLVTFGVGAARLHVPELRSEAAGLSTLDRSVRRHARRAACVGGVRASSTARGQRLWHGHRRLHTAAGDATRMRGLLPDGHHRLFRGDGDTDRAGPLVRRHGSHRRSCGDRERGVCPEVLEGSRSDRPAGQAALWRPDAVGHGRWRGQGCQAGWRRAGNRHRAVLPARAAAARLPDHCRSPAR